MKNFVYLFHVAKTIEDTAEQNAAWGAWFESLGDKVVDGGSAFDSKSEARIKEGTVDVGADTVAGYSIVKAENLDAAVEMAKTCPLATAPDCWVKVYEALPM